MCTYYALTLVVIGLINLLVSGTTTAKRGIAGIATFLASVFFLIYTVAAITQGPVESMSRLFTWRLPFAGLATGVDTLSSFFLVPLLVLSAVGALYGSRYFDGHDESPYHWLLYALLVSGMVLVLCARNAVFFLLAWEVMSLSSFFLVITDHKKEQSLYAGWLYFVTAHIGTVFLLLLFFMLASSSGSFDFESWENSAISPVRANLIFITALIAFGMKAGFIPFHVWLPHAHPAAPSHVSALMSGIMIKMGIYGILRILPYITPYHAWWGITLLFLGALSGILGVLYAIGQHDIKRLLAYHSVENIGIILLGMGIGIIGNVYGMETIALVGFTGALLHVLNHALFKSLLFLGAGAVIRQTGSGDLDRLGGLLKSMPWTGAFFLTGAAAICGLPFLNGFISEFLIYSAAIKGIVQSHAPIVAIAGLFTVLSLALIGGLAVACFTKVFGIVFLGEPRSVTFKQPFEAPLSMLIGMAIPAIVCVFIGLGSFLIIPFVVHPAAQLALGKGSAGHLGSIITTVSLVLVSILISTAVIVGIIKTFRRRKTIEASSITWDCGYCLPSSSMQYTASSFAAPILAYFSTALAYHETVQTDKSLLPANPWTFQAHVDDWFLSKIYAPGVHFFNRLFSLLRWFQNGKTGHYVLYIAVTIFILILWKFFI